MTWKPKAELAKQAARVVKAQPIAVVSISPGLEIVPNDRGCISLPDLIAAIEAHRRRGR